MRRKLVYEFLMKMLRLLFIAFVAIHALIHLLGFVKEWKLANVPQLNGPTLLPLSHMGARAMGLGWLVASVLLLLVAILFTVRYANWWMVACTGVVVSQFLIVVYWHDAKFGTIANILIAVVVACAWAHWRFERTVAADVAALYKQNGALQTEVLGNEQIAHLPPVVQKWLRRSGVLGKPVVGIARIEQRGTMLTKPGGSWMPFAAQQHTALQTPGFVWETEMGDNPLMTIGGRDRYLGGVGNMYISLLYLYPIVNARGFEIDQGSLVRYLAELVWFPSAAANKRITWKAINDTTAAATITVGETTATGQFYFDTNGDCIAFEAPRYMSNNNAAPTLEQWRVQSKAFKKFGGVRIPAQSEITWKLKAGDYTWLRLEITSVEYNPAAPQAK
jgi:hypothetical protein